MLATASYAKRDIFQHKERTINSSLFCLYILFFCWTKRVTMLVVSADATVYRLELNFVISSVHSGQADCPMFTSIRVTINVFKNWSGSTTICIIKMIHYLCDIFPVNSATTRSDSVVKAEPHYFVGQFHWQAVRGREVVNSELLKNRHVDLDRQING
jgi:hypothetical protein